MSRRIAVVAQALVLTIMGACCQTISKVQLVQKFSQGLPSPHSASLLPESWLGSLASAPSSETLKFAWEHRPTAGARRLLDGVFVLVLHAEDVVATGDDVRLLNTTDAQ